jgi:replication factor A1
MHYKKDKVPQPSSISCAHAASMSASTVSVAPEGTPSQTPHSTKTYGKDKVNRACKQALRSLCNQPRPPYRLPTLRVQGRQQHQKKVGTTATRQVARNILGDLAGRTGDGDSSASIAADSRYNLSLFVPCCCLQ